MSAATHDTTTSHDSTVAQPARFPGRSANGRDRAISECPHSVCPRKDASWQSPACPGPPPEAPDRVSFAKLREPLEVPNLLALQTDSFDWLVGGPDWRARQAEPTPSGLDEILEEISPIEDFSGNLSLSFSDPRFDEVKANEEECRDKDMTYSAPLFVTAEFMNGETGEIKSQTVFMGDFPMMTSKGTFIINGTERVVVVPAGPLARASTSTRTWTRPPARTSSPSRSSRRGVPGSSSTSTSATPSACASTASAASRSPCC